MKLQVTLTMLVEVSDQKAMETLGTVDPSTAALQMTAIASEQAAELVAEPPIRGFDVLSAGVVARAVYG